LALQAGLDLPRHQRGTPRILIELNVSIGKFNPILFDNCLSVVYAVHDTVLHPEMVIYKSLCSSFLYTSLQN
jgi:hypothetical protein